MTAAARRQNVRDPRRLPPAAVGLGALVAFFLVVELLIQTGVINRFIVPPPSEIIGSFGRVIVEEHMSSAASCSPSPNASPPASC